MFWIKIRPLLLSKKKGKIQNLIDVKEITHAFFFTKILYIDTKARIPSIVTIYAKPLN